MKLTWTWTRFTDLGVQGLYDALQLRAKVFILEQGPYLDPDGIDQYSWHLLGRDENGALRVYLRVVDPGLKYEEPSIGRQAAEVGSAFTPRALRLRCARPGRSDVASELARHSKYPVTSSITWVVPEYWVVRMARAPVALKPTTAELDRVWPTA